MQKKLIVSNWKNHPDTLAEAMRDLANWKLGQLLRIDNRCLLVKLTTAPQRKGSELLGPALNSETDGLRYRVRKRCL